jgi:hypothetical protein
LLFLFNIMFQALVISVFFTKSKVGNICGMVIYLGLYIVTFLLSDSMDINDRTALSLIP